MSNWIGNAVVRNVEEDLLLGRVHHCEVISHVEVLRQSSPPEVKELGMSTRYIDADVLVRDGLGDEHVVLRHDDAVTSIEDFVHGLEEVVGLVEVDALLPSLAGLLVALEIRVVSDEDSGLRLLLAKLAEAESDAGRLLRDAPGEVEDVALHELPGVSEVLRDIELLVDLAWLVVVEVSARRPSSCQGPLPLIGMEMEFVNLLAGVECSQVGTAILSDPIDAVCTY
mgnify:CR=1 FL=1